MKIVVNFVVLFKCFLDKIIDSILKFILMYCEIMESGNVKSCIIVF